MINCPPNCNEYHKKLKTINGYDIYHCSFCDHRFARIEKSMQHVRDNYNDSYFFDGGTGGYPNYLLESELLFQRGKQYAKILKKVGLNGGKLLDIGSAAGFILKGFNAQGWQGVGIEPNKTMVKFAQTELGLNVHHSSLEEFESEDKFDCITLIQVVAHFYDFDKVMNKLNGLLKKDGYLLIETWNRDSLTAKLMGWKWHEYSPPTVVHWFSIKSLTEMFRQNNYKLVKKGRLLKKINAKHAKMLLSEKIELNYLKKLLKIIPDKVNFIYPSEDLFYLILKKKLM